MNGVRRLEHVSRDGDIGNAFAPILDQALSDQRAESFGGHVRGIAFEIRFGADHRRQRLHDIVARKGAPAGEHLVEHATERPHVTALVGGPALRLLGAHVGRRAEDHARLCHARRTRDRR
jgi:hypothetical protein